MRVIVLCLLAAVTLDQQHSVSSSSWECIVLCCCCCRDHQSLGGIETKKFASKWNVSLLLWNFHWLHIHDILHGAGRTTQCCAGYLVTLHSSSSPHWLWLMLSASMPLCPASAPLWPVCVAGAKSRLEMAPCEHWELLAAASPPFLHFPSFSQSGAGMGRHQCCIRSIGFDNHFSQSRITHGSGTMITKPSVPYDFCISKPI